MTIRELCQAAQAEVEAIMLEPIHDPHAPAGYVRRTWSIADLRRRDAAARAVIARLLERIEREYGPVPAALAREHFAALFAELGDTELH